MNILEKIDQYLINELFDTKTDLEVLRDNKDDKKYQFSVEGKRYTFRASRPDPFDVDKIWYLDMEVSKDNRTKFLTKQVSPFPVIAGFKACFDKFLGDVDNKNLWGVIFNTEEAGTRDFVDFGQKEILKRYPQFEVGEKLGRNTILVNKNYKEGVWDKINKFLSRPMGDITKRNK